MTFRLWLLLGKHYAIQNRGGGSEFWMISIKKIFSNGFLSTETFRKRKMLLSRSMLGDKLISWDPEGVVSVRWICCPIGISDQLPLPNISLPLNLFKAQG